MAHFAEIDDNNVVLRVVVVDNSEVLNAEGLEDEQVGIAFCQNLFGGNWVQTSYNNSFRGIFAGPGFMYDEDLDVFVEPQPEETGS